MDRINYWNEQRCTFEAENFQVEAFQDAYNNVVSFLSKGQIGWTKDPALCMSGYTISTSSNVTIYLTIYDYTSLILPSGVCITLVPGSGTLVASGVSGDTMTGWILPDKMYVSGAKDAYTNQATGSVNADLGLSAKTPNTVGVDYVSAYNPETSAYDTAFYPFLTNVHQDKSNLSAQNKNLQFQTLLYVTTATPTEISAKYETSYDTISNRKTLQFFEEYQQLFTIDTSGNVSISGNSSAITLQHASATPSAQYYEPWDSADRYASGSSIMKFIADTVINNEIIEYVTISHDNISAGIAQATPFDGVLFTTQDYANSYLNENKFTCVGTWLPSSTTSSARQPEPIPELLSNYAVVSGGDIIYFSRSFDETSATINVHRVPSSTNYSTIETLFSINTGLDTQDDTTATVGEKSTESPIEISHYGEYTQWDYASKLLLPYNMTLSSITFDVSAIMGDPYTGTMSAYICSGDEVPTGGCFTSATVNVASISLGENTIIFPVGVDIPASSTTHWIALDYPNAAPIGTGFYLYKTTYGNYAAFRSNTDGNPVSSWINSYDVGFWVRASGYSVSVEKLAHTLDCSIVYKDDYVGLLINDTLTTYHTTGAGASAYQYSLTGHDGGQTAFIDHPVCGIYAIGGDNYINSSGTNISLLTGSDWPSGGTWQKINSIVGAPNRCAATYVTAGPNPGIYVVPSLNYSDIENINSGASFSYDHMHAGGIYFWYKYIPQCGFAIIPTYVNTTVVSNGIILSATTTPIETTQYIMTGAISNAERQPITSATWQVVSDGSNSTYAYADFGNQSSVATSYLTFDTASLVNEIPDYATISAVVVYSTNWRDSSDSNAYIRTGIKIGGQSFYATQKPTKNTWVNTSAVFLLDPRDNSAWTKTKVAEITDLYVYHNAQAVFSTVRTSQLSASVIWQQFTTDGTVKANFYLGSGADKQFFVSELVPSSTSSTYNISGSDTMGGSDQTWADVKHNDTIGSWEWYTVSAYLSGDTSSTPVINDLSIETQGPKPRIANGLSQFIKIETDGSVTNLTPPPWPICGNVNSQANLFTFNGSVISRDHLIFLNGGQSQSAANINVFVYDTISNTWVDYGPKYYGYINRLSGNARYYEYPGLIYDNKLILVGDDMITFHSIPNYLCVYTKLSG